ncbi:MAG: tetratricopeptide repeat protein [Bryobacteraceae bacterium]|nr:tetratricopeptide repeat protein [Bryobacteraceae bacterium]
MSWLVATSLYLMLSPSAGPSFEDIRELIRRGQLPEALAASEQALKLQPQDYRVLTLRGIVLQSLARRADGLEALRRALAVKADFLPALQASAQLEYETGDPGARKTLEKLVSLRPDAAVHGMLGVLAFERKDCAQSVRHFENATVAIATQALARWQFATCLFQVGRFADAEQQFAALLGEKEDEQIRYNLGLARFSGGRYPEAIDALEPLRLSKAADVDALSLLAAAYEAQKRTPEAVATLQRAIELFPGEERLYIDLAGLCLEHNSILLAVDVMETGIRNHPRSARMETVAGLAHVRAGNMERASEHYRKADELAPDSGFGPVARSMMLLQLGAADEAVRMLREQRSRGPNAKVNIALAQALLQKGVETSGLVEVESLLSGTLADEDARVLTLKAKVQLLRERPQQAAPLLEAALKLDPNDRGAAYQLMMVYRRLGRADDLKRMQARVRELMDHEKRAEAESGRYRLLSAPMQPKLQ